MRPTPYIGPLKTIRMALCPFLRNLRTSSIKLYVLSEKVLTTFQETDSVAELFFRFFDRLPLTVLVELSNKDAIFCCHGGFPHMSQEDGLGFLWNDPRDGLGKKWEDSSRGPGCYFFSKEVTEFELSKRGLG